MTLVEQGGREGGGGAFRLWQVSDQTFWTFLDPADFSARGGGEGYATGACGQGRLSKGLRAVMNAAGMLQECGLFLGGGPLKGGRCDPGGNHRIIILFLLTLLYSNNTHTHTFYWNILCQKPCRGRRFNWNSTPTLCGLPPTLTAAVCTL